jgi:HAD superfamily hydrolase (TIGR01549 family)
VGDTLLAETRFDLDAGIASVVSTDTHIPILATSFRAEVVASHLRQSEPSLAGWIRERVPELALRSVESIEDTVWDAVVSLEPQPGTATVLSVLARDGVVLAAISNAAFSGRMLEKELKRHGLAQYFQFVVTSADVGLRKPAVGIFAQALARLGVAAADAWFVGDTLAEDIAGARAAGLLPICMALQESPASPVELLTVRNWRELGALYESVRAPAGSARWLTRE